MAAKIGQSIWKFIDERFLLSGLIAFAKKKTVPSTAVVLVLFRDLPLPDRHQIATGSHAPPLLYAPHRRRP
jgi:hypothetical protein